MSNIVLEALKSKLESLKSQEVDLNNQVKEYDTQVINNWKKQYIDAVPFISNSAKEKLVITRDNSGFEFTCTADKWRSGITVKRNANWYSKDGIRPELSWFSSSTDKTDKNNYLDILQVLGLVAGYMQGGLNPFEDLMATYDACIENEKTLFGDISSKIYDVENGIRSAERQQKDDEKESVLRKGVIECYFEDEDDSWYYGTASFYASADKYSNKRFTHMKWEENKGGKTYKVSGYTLKKKEDGTFEKRNTWYVDRVKKDRLMDGIESAINIQKEHAEKQAKKATEVVA